MQEKTNKKISKKVSGGDELEFPLEIDEVSSSPVKLAGGTRNTVAEDVLMIDAVPTAAKIAEKEYSPEFLELAEPKLPSLSKINRGQLLMQSPNKLYFYWSVGKNPFHTLNRALGQAGNYSLVLKLVNMRTETEDIHPVDASGNWWFDVDADGEYRAEIGFYAVNRPYIRVLFSNTVVTPRKSPSPRIAAESDWRVPAEKFARVLDVAGFARDAFDVALAGDDLDAADVATRSAFAQFSGRLHDEFAGVESSEIRYAMLALGSGVALAELRGLISESLFTLLSTVAGNTGERALAAIRDKFEFDTEDFDVEEEMASPAVFGSSLINFPRSKRNIPQRLAKPREFPGPVSPFSSHSLLR